MRILLLASDCIQTRVAYNYLKNDYDIVNVVIENRIKKTKFIKTRLKKTGLAKTLDQLLFIVILGKLLSFFAKSRITEIFRNGNLDITPIPGNFITRVENVNSDSSITLLNSIEADIIFVSGTRIISKKVLNQLSIPMINIHAGITPDYRGVHGAYWALVNNEREIAGVTVHYIDKGVDTGAIIAQERIIIGPNDNVITYPILQLKVGLDLLKIALQNKFSMPGAGKYLGKGKSRQWYHPGFFEYLYHRLLKGVK